MGHGWDCRILMSRILLSALFVLTTLGGRELRAEDWGELSFSSCEACFLEEGEVRLGLYYAIPYDQLRFLSREGGYLASIYVTAVCLDPKGGQKAGEVWDRQVFLGQYETTKLRTSFFVDSLSFAVEPGKYTLRVEVRDRHSQRKGLKLTEVEVRDMKAEGLGVSDLHFLILSESTYVPHPARTYDGRSPLLVSYEVYRLSPIRTALNREWRVEDAKGRAVLQGRGLIQAPEEVNHDTLKVPLDSLRAGEHILVVSIEEKSSNKRREARGRFSFQPPPFLSEESYLLMVDQLEYIGKALELLRLREAKPEEREERWEEFWKARDPSPGTERNEVREEYLRRVEYANKHFSSFREGWRTDMGRVYIIYGSPDDTERHPFDLDSPPYEIWYYYGEGLKFIFLDEHGLGDYELVSPRGASFGQPKFK